MTHQEARLELRWKAQRPSRDGETVYGQGARGLTPDEAADMIRSLSVQLPQVEFVTRPMGGGRSFGSVQDERR